MPEVWRNGKKTLTNVFEEGLTGELQFVGEFNTAYDFAAQAELLGPGYSSFLGMVETDLIGDTDHDGLSRLNVPGKHKARTVSVGFNG